MRKIWTTTLIFMLFTSISAQNLERLNVQTFHLENGLTVVMAEEHSAPKIFGSVIVHAGSKNEDTAYTGVAHYFEHMMFKGTDRIGTTDWAKEKVYLDSISMMYDKLRETKDEEGRKAVQKEINRLNIEASKFAIANETDAILQKMGCTGLNAGTSYDFTVYYNTLPSNQLENWMDVYVERFRNPVYRLFQSELEAVYEERNLYANSSMYDFTRNIFKESFGDHPYSRDVIGLDDHLKNPQPSQMKIFYDKYYVASNMTLLLVGDFNTAEALKMVKERFGVWPKGEPQPKVTYELPKFESHVVKEVKQTPIKAGLMFFPGVPSHHPDKLPLEMISALLSGGNGSMNKLSTSGKLLAAYLIPLSMEEAGSNVILYIPKLLGQKHAEAEELIWGCIDSIKQGLFSDQLLESIKMQSLRDRLEQLESNYDIAMLLEELICEGSSYDEWERDNERLQNMTREEIMEVANRYFDNNRHTSIRSSMGLPKKSAAVKPDWDHLDIQNQGVQSEFAQMIGERSVKEITPQVIDFNKSVTILPITSGCDLYASPNPKNNIFSMTIRYHYGEADDKRLETATSYMEMIGAGEMDLHQFEIELKKLGGDYSISSDYDNIYLEISGFEENIEAILSLVTLKLQQPKHDAQQLKNLIDETKADKKESKNEASTWNSALYNYLQYGKHSLYLEQLTVKELKKLTGEELVAILEPMYQRDGHVTFVGNSEPERIREILLEKGLVRPGTVKTAPRVRPRVIHDTNTVYYLTNKSFMKSDIRFITQYGGNFDLKDAAAATLFDEYFGGGMNSVVFQEIREFRSLGYSTYGYFNYDALNRYHPYLGCYLGTQCDKTNEGVDAMMELIRTFPERPEKFPVVQQYIISTRNSNYVNFRNIPSQVRYWKEIRHFESDPREKTTGQIRKMSYDDLRAFHVKYIQDKPQVIGISGNTKKFDLKALGKYGKVVKLNFKDIIRY
ncbi:MAG: insulinase family protein [Bacteroidales bacterium]|nr:insulinase family protein [Bacteroidales bacterium]